MQSKAIPDGASATRWQGSGVYPRRRPWEAFAAVGRFDFLEALAGFDLFDFFNIADAVDALDLFELVDLLGPFDPFDPAGSE